MSSFLARAGHVELFADASDVYDPVLYRLMTFPLLTIAAINGHGALLSLIDGLHRGCANLAAFAGGMVLALACDYRLMTSGKGLMCMNEVTTTPVMTDARRARQLTT